MKSLVDINSLKSNNVEHLTLIAQATENCGAYEEMYSIMNRLVAMAPTITMEMRNLLSVAYKNVVGPIRQSLRLISNELDENTNSVSCDDLRSIMSIRKENLMSTCKEILEVIDKTIIPKLDKAKHEDVVFFQKMKADYNRYLAETESSFGELSLKNYKEAYELANEHLSRTHPTRLGLLLNYSVCLYEIAKTPSEACKLAKKGFDEAMSNLEDVDEEEYQESTNIMQLLRDNITLWTSDDDIAGLKQTENDSKKECC